MKRIIMYEILNRIGKQPQLKRKLKKFAIVGVIGFVIVSGLTIWAGFSAARFAANQISAVNIQNQIENINTHLSNVPMQIEQLPAITTVSCVNKARSLLSVELWLTQPLVETFNDLKSACLGSPSSCQGENCPPLETQAGSESV